MSMFYKHEKDSPSATLEFSGSVLDLTAEISYIIHKTHAAFHNSDPNTASAFRKLLIQLVTDEDAPTWQVEAPSEGETSIVIHSPKQPNKPTE